MIYLVMVLVIVGTGVLTARAAGHRRAPIRSLMPTIVRVGIFIALLRLGLFWGSLALYTGSDGWGQVVGYGLLIGNAFVEFAIAASWFGGPAPPLLAAALVTLASVMLGFVWGGFGGGLLSSERSNPVCGRRAPGAVVSSAAET